MTPTPAPRRGARGAPPLAARDAPHLPRVGEQGRRHPALAAQRQRAHGRPVGLRGPLHRRWAVARCGRPGPRARLRFRVEAEGLVMLQELEDGFHPNPGAYVVATVDLSPTIAPGSRRTSSTPRPRACLHSVAQGSCSWCTRTRRSFLRQSSRRGLSRSTSVGPRSRRTSRSRRRSGFDVPGLGRSDSSRSSSRPIALRAGARAPG